MITTIENTLFPTTLAEFIDWDTPVDGYKYEWNDGDIIKSEKMKRKHLKLIHLLGRAFTKSISYKNGGELIPEQDVMLTGIQMRRPDLAYFSGEQIADSDNDEEPIPSFVIEVISPTDDGVKIETKVIEYFKAGVQVLWHIFPDNQTIYVYTSRKIVKICTDDDICSASPAIDDFQISVSELLGNI